MWMLLLNRYVLGGIALVALAFYLHHAKGTYDDARRAEGSAPYIAAIAKQKTEAAAQLAAKIAENAAITQKWIDYARNSNDDYEKQITAIRNAHNAADGVRLYDPGRRPSNSCPATSKDGAGISQDATATSELSPELTDFLKSEASRADTAATYALRAQQDALKCYSTHPI